MTVLDKIEEYVYPNIVVFLNDENEWDTFEELYNIEKDLKKKFNDNSTFSDIEELLHYCGSDLDGISDVVHESWEGKYFIDFIEDNIGYIRVVKLEEKEE